MKSAMTLGSTFGLALMLIGIAAPARADTFYHYDCTDGASFDLTFAPGIQAAYLQVDGQSLALPKRFSLTSQRFKKNGISLAMRAGGKAILKHSGRTSQCQVR